MNNISRNSVLRQVAVSVLVATLLIRALLPLGYMPGNLLGGEFATLCPVASSATFQLIEPASAHDHHVGDDAESFSVGTACPIGSSLFFDALPSISSPLALTAALPAQLETNYFLPVRTATLTTHHARAPPLS
ncbi:MAG: hypothetical protein ACR2QS_14085 [Woeseiaceae bacterium]